MTGPAFATEQSMVDSFVEQLSTSGSPWPVTNVCCEFDYRRGRTDVVALTFDGQVVAFEAKLARWREAMHQAYRNRCFADASFVVLPKSVALAAANYGVEFERRGIGICYLDAVEGVVVVTEAHQAEPLQPWLRERAVACVAADGLQCRTS